jgi:hypothetical protein
MDESTRATVPDDEVGQILSEVPDILLLDRLVAPVATEHPGEAAVTASAGLECKDEPMAVGHAAADADHRLARALDPREEAGAATTLLVLNDRVLEPQHPRARPEVGFVEHDGRNGVPGFERSSDLVPHDPPRPCKVL